MSQKQAIELTSMNRILLSKLLLIGGYFLLMLLFFYKEHLFISTDTVHHFDSIAFMAVTISFGAIVSSTIYNFSLYIYLKNRQYLYYSLAQLSSLLFLINLDAIFISPFDTIFGFKSIIFFDISQLSMLIFSLLFLQAFFRSYQVRELDGLIRAILYLALIDILIALLFSHAFFVRFIPIFIPILLVLSESARYVKERDLPFYLILVGWSTVLMVVISEYFGILQLIGITFPFLHIAIALESIILSIAIAYKFKLLEQEREQQKTLMLQQSRLASMGEMVSGIVHQWRQPLNVISFGLMNIKKNSKGQDKNLATIKKLNEQVQYMSHTIEDFRNFYNPSRVKEEFGIYQAIKNSHTIARSTLDRANIEFSIEVKQDFTLYGHQNELEQVILNIINNAKDSLILSNTQNPTISVVIDAPTIKIEDNGEGIKEEHLSKIFNPYFSTKKSGDGIGLYLSQMIIQKELKGEIWVNSSKQKTTFFIKFDKSDFF